MNGVHLYRAYWCKLMMSPLTYIAVLLIFAVSTIRFFSEPMPNVGCADYVDLLLDMDTYRKIIPIFAALPFAAAFSQEYTSKCYLYVLSRSGEKKYIRAHILMNVFSSFLVTAVGLLLFVLFLSLQMPLYIADGNDTVPPYGFLLTDGFAFVYILIKIVIYAFSLSVWMLAGAAVTSFFPNTYTAICSPFIFSYIVEKLMLKFPYAVNMYYLSLGRDVLNAGAIITFLYTMLVFAVLDFGLGLLFRAGVRRRIRCEMV